MEVAVIVVALIIYFGFQQWLRQSRRNMIHRERLAAIERGTELPALELEVRRGSWNVQRILLLAGLCWISIGIAVYVALSVVIPHMPPESAPPQGMQWIGLAPIGVGLSHLLVYLVGRDKDRSA